MWLTKTKKNCVIQRNQGGEVKEERIRNWQNILQVNKKTSNGQEMQRYRWLV